MEYHKPVIPKMCTFFTGVHKKVVGGDGSDEYGVGKKIIKTKSSTNPEILSPKVVENENFYY